MPPAAPHVRSAATALPPGVQSIQSWEAQYPDMWLLLEITSEDEGEPLAGSVLAIATDPGEFQDVWQAARAHGILTMVTYGPPHEPCPAVVLSAS